ncbi:hypothetical protein [Agromyces larvae]|uniref:Uncharacterized protein n=1 Tax=Agromyces larvae TaxID=2929802 RepID=A0ABY4BZ22_9MICO|nr:hypothetical protein [Agromyces larvae]UOE43442.1 hypothetical protein MTO99_14830 [Agromyces larvae]
MPEDREFCEVEGRLVRRADRVRLDGGWLHITPDDDADTRTSSGHMTSGEPVDFIAVREGGAWRLESAEIDPGGIDVPPAQMNSPRGGGVRGFRHRIEAFNIDNTQLVKPPPPDDA